MSNKMATELDGKYTVKLDPNTDIMRNIHLYNYFFKHVEPLIYGEPRNEITFSKYRFHLNITGEIFEFGLSSNQNVERIDKYTLQIVKLSKEDTAEMKIVILPEKNMYLVPIGAYAFLASCTLYRRIFFRKTIFIIKTI